MSKSAAEIAKELAAFFPVASLGWRPGPVAREKDVAIAFPYIDSRDVMDRLDQVVGIGNWKDEYDFLPSGQVACKLHVLIDGLWVDKMDVGGQSDQEDSGDKLKSAVSDALKRAAVKFGIGRYLYSFPDQWVVCEKRKDGKFSKFTGKPTVPARFMSSDDLASAKASAGEARSAEAAAKAKPAEPTPPKAEVSAKEIPKTGKALKERLEKADKTSKGILEFVVHCGLLYGYPTDITKWAGAQLEQAVTFGKEFARRLKEKPKKITEEHDAEIRVLVAGDLEKLQQACRTAMIYNPDGMLDEEAVKVLAVLKGEK